jgi:hypothetical protein
MDAHGIECYSSNKLLFSFLYANIRLLLLLHYYYIVIGLYWNYFIFVAIIVVLFLLFGNLDLNIDCVCIGYSLNVRSRGHACNSCVILFIICKKV